MTYNRPSRTLLAVDDNRTNLSVLGSRLSAAGYMMVLAASGREALDRIAGGGIDLVLLATPALEVLAELRGSRETCDLPVIMITGRSDPEAAIAALASGADDWLAKPFAFEVLEARIDRTLARAGRLAELQRAAAALDARVAQRAIELGETRDALAHAEADRVRLLSSLTALQERLAAS